MGQAQMRSGRYRVLRFGAMRSSSGLPRGGVGPVLAIHLEAADVRELEVCGASG